VSGPDDTVERAKARARARASAVLADEPTASPRRARPRRARRLIWPVLASVLFVGILFVAVFPTQTYLQQQEEVEARRERLAEIEAEASELEARVAALQGDEAVELLAREEWGFVFPGEEAYAIVGLGATTTVPATTTTTTTTAPPTTSPPTTSPPADSDAGTTPATATTGTD
jgi:cell division protein FtsB